MDRNIPRFKLLSCTFSPATIRRPDISISDALPWVYFTILYHDELQVTEVAINYNIRKQFAVSLAIVTQLRPKAVLYLNFDPSQTSGASLTDTTLGDHIVLTLSPVNIYGISYAMFQV